VSVIGLKKDAVSEQGDAAVDAGRRISGRHEARRLRAAELPDLPACSRVQRAHLVDRRHVHHAVDNERRHLKSALAAHLMGPLRGKRCDVAGIDSIQRAVAICAEMTVVARPLASFWTHDIVEGDLARQLGVRDAGEQEKQENECKRSRHD